MYGFKNEKVTGHIKRLYAMGGETGVQMYLVEGVREALLIDTATGVGDLKKYVGSLTHLPIKVALTHGHCDHANGTYGFDEVYMSDLDREIYKEHSKIEWRKAYINTSRDHEKVTDADYMPSVSSENFKNIKDGDVFDLGGVRVEAIALGGHTPGSMMFLVIEDRILIAGDAVNFFTMLQDKSCLSVSKFEDNLKAAKERVDGRYDKILFSHGLFNTPNDLIDRVIEVCEEIKAGTDDKIPFGFMGGGGFVAKAFGSKNGTGYMRKDGGFGNIVYREDGI